MYSEFDKVMLSDGTIATVLEVFGDGKAYQVEYPTPDGPHRYDDKVVSPGDIVGKAEATASSA